MQRALSVCAVHVEHAAFNSIRARAHAAARFGTANGRIRERGIVKSASGATTAAAVAQAQDLVNQR
jgi:hypothetical protein